MNLYFNTKIVASTIHRNNPNIFYPVVMPKKYFFDENLQYEILKSVIKSYSKLDFSKCIFNIEIDSDSKKKEIKSLIEANFDKEITHLNFSRPFDKNSWLNDIDKNFNHNMDECTLVVMNHDHKFIDNQNNTFYSVVNKIFPNDNNNFKKILYYSHIPELISKSVNKKYFQNKKFVSQDNSYYEIKHINFQVDSFALMTPRTLDYVLSNIKKEIDYFGRLDWKDLFFNKLKLHGFFFAREFFRHFEGYSHISGLRITEELNLDDIDIDFKDQDVMDKTKFYYNAWKNFSVFTLKDGLLINNSRKNYISLIEKSIKIFTSTYLLEDLKYNLISKSQYNLIEQNLRNLIYYNANDIYSKIKTDNILTNNSIFDKIKNFYNSRFRYFKIIIYLKNFLKK